MVRLAARTTWPPCWQRQSCWNFSFTLGSLNNLNPLRLATHPRYLQVVQIQKVGLMGVSLQEIVVIDNTNSSIQHTHKIIRQHAILRTPGPRHHDSTFCSCHRKPRHQQHALATIPSSSPTHVRQLHQYHRRNVSLPISLSTTPQTNIIRPQHVQRPRANLPLSRHPRH